MLLGRATRDHFSRSLRAAMVFRCSSTASWRPSWGRSCSQDLLKLVDVDADVALVVAEAEAVAVALLVAAVALAVE